MSQRISTIKRLTEFGKELRKLRGELGLTIAQLSTKLGVSGSYLSSREIGKAPISLTLIEKITNTFNLSDEYKQKLITSAIRSTPIVRIKLTSATAIQRETAFNFSQKIHELSEEQCVAILSLLNKDT